MASRKLVRDLLFSRNSVFLHPSCQRVSCTGIDVSRANRYAANRGFSVFNEFSKRIKGEATRNPEFQQSFKELKEKAEELKGVKEELKVRTKQKTEQLYKHVDGVWTEAEAAAKKASANMKDKISAATEEVKESLGIGKQESSASTGTSTEHDPGTKDHSQAASGEETEQQPGTADSEQTVFGRFKATASSSLPKVSVAFQKLKETKVIDIAKKGYGIVKDELTGAPTNRKHIEYAPTPNQERSTRTDVVVIPTKQSRWSKKWEEFKGKMKDHSVFKHINAISEPVRVKGQEIAEDVQERWETSDSPIVHKIQDLNESIFQETDAAASYKEIRSRDPYFSLPDLVVEVQEIISTVLNAYMKADVEALKKYCTSEVIERCKAEHKAYQSNGIFFDNKILHVSEVEVRETKMMGTSPIIILAFQTQQIYCVRDRNGSITEGGKDTIHTVYYAWAMQQIPPEELGEGAIYPVWRLREMQQLGVQALI